MGSRQSTPWISRRRFESSERDERRVRSCRQSSLDLIDDRRLWKTMVCHERSHLYRLSSLTGCSGRPSSAFTLFLSHADASFSFKHSFVVDDCHRHVSSIVAASTPTGSSMDHVWIALQGSHEIRLYHATHFTCLLETSIRTVVAQKLQGHLPFTLSVNVLEHGSLNGILLFSV